MAMHCKTSIASASGKACAARLPRTVALPNRHRESMRNVCCSVSHSAAALATLSAAMSCVSATIVSPAAALDITYPMYTADYNLASASDGVEQVAAYITAEAPSLQVTDAEVALQGMLQVADLLSAATSDLLSVKEGNASLPLSDVAQRMSQQALALASQAIALSSYDLPETEKALVEQIRVAAQQVSNIADSIAAQTT